MVAAVGYAYRLKAFRAAPTVVTRASASCVALAVLSTASRAARLGAHFARPTFCALTMVWRHARSVRTAAFDADGVLASGSLPSRLAQADAWQLTGAMRSARALGLSAKIAAPPGLARELAVEPCTIGATEALPQSALATVTRTVRASSWELQCGDAVDNCERERNTRSVEGQSRSARCCCCCARARVCVWRTGAFGGGVALDTHIGDATHQEQSGVEEHTSMAKGWHW